MYSHLQYDPSQLVARVRSHLKQYERLTRKQEKEADSTEKITIQNLVIEPGTWKVWKDGEELRLLNREFELLCFLAKHPNLVFSKEKLFEAVWGEKYLDGNNTVMVHIRRLREKLGEKPRDPKFIKTVWGVGYKIGK